MKHYFDFNAAAKEFSRIINDTLSSQKKEGEEP